MQLRFSICCSQGQPISGRKLVQVFVDTPRGRNTRETRVQSQRIAIDLAVKTRILANCFQLRSEDKVSINSSVVKRLDSQTVADQMQSGFVTVPQREGKHADEALYCRIDSPAFEGREHNFSIGVPMPMCRAQL